MHVLFYMCDVICVYVWRGVHLCDVTCADGEGGCVRERECVCVRVCEREREGVVCVCTFVFVCVRVCV